MLAVSSVWIFIRQSTKCHAHASTNTKADLALSTVQVYTKNWNLVVNLMYRHFEVTFPGCEILEPNCFGPLTRSKTFEREPYILLFIEMNAPS